VAYFVTLVLMTSLDLLAEPVTMKLGFWSWNNNIIPLQNYEMWLLTSIFIHGIIYLFKPKINAKISSIIIGVSTLFFGFFKYFTLGKSTFYYHLNEQKK
jgi:putative membrane protein